MSVSMTRKELAELVGYTYRWMYDINNSLPDEDKFFVSGDENNKCDLSTFIRKWTDYNVAARVRDVTDLDEVKARHEIVKTKKTELEVARLSGRMVDVQDAKRLWGSIANTVMQNMIHLPSKLAPRLLMMDNVEMISSIIDEEIRRVLEIGRAHV